ncbi:hypothetical protein [Solwaraspora sp. WMMA2065]|uniref:hypothetical protein n=1 Tax=Solwaraspora sp. WMMA2065 TaxID=3015166 RepID=UPI00259BDF94|nr:hypothetical protein [Solwaraspora sp. WMMA2065]WJK33092.1 hypothetical protein O7610_20545 [Solwaraspora sp. WMMA2065]
MTTAHGHCCAGAAATATHRHVMSCMASAVVSGYLCGLAGDDIAAAGGLPAAALVLVVMFAAMGVPAAARHVRALAARALLAGICWSREFRAWRPTGTDTPAVLILMLRRGNGRGPG